MLESADRLDDLIMSFDVEKEVLASPIDSLTRFASILNSETAFTAVPNGFSGFDIPYVYTESGCMKDAKTIPRVNSLSEVIRRNEAITVNEKDNIDDELRELGVESMLAVPIPLPDKAAVLTACNRKAPQQFGAMYISYDVKICSMIAFFLSRGLQLFEEHFELTARGFNTLQSDVNELKNAVQKLTETVRGIARPGSTGIVMSDFVRERDAYLRMERELLDKYPEQFVGIYKGELVAVNPDKMELMVEIRKTKGNIRAFIRKVAEEQPQIKLPTSRRMTK